jgi:hypothetical protein
MVNPTIPDDISRWEKGDPASLIQVSQAIGDATQAALNKRQRFDFVWADDAERLAESFMVQGSRGFQLDTESDYIYLDSEWRLYSGHAEWTFSEVVPTNNVTPFGTLAFDANDSTSSTLTSTSTIPETGQLKISYPGIYGVSVILETGGAISNRAFVEVSHEYDDDIGDAIIARTSILSGEDKGGLAVPNLWITHRDHPLFFRAYHNTGSSHTFTGRIRVTRIG